MLKYIFETGGTVYGTIGFDLPAGVYHARLVLNMTVPIQPYVAEQTAHVFAWSGDSSLTYASGSLYGSAFMLPTTSLTNSFVGFAYVGGDQFIYSTTGTDGTSTSLATLHDELDMVVTSPGSYTPYLFVASTTVAGALKVAGTASVTYRRIA
jgi:hypothetical protein